MKYTLLYILIFFCSPLFSQQPSCNCCTPNHADFNFWVGEWVVYDTLGNKLGENVIKKVEIDCLLTEQWTGSSGSSGRSMNYYEPKDSTWNQIWVSNGGTNLILKGKFVNDAMVLRSDIIAHPKSNYMNQITWKSQDNGTVTQTWDLIDENGQLLRTIFHGVYIPRRSPLESPVEPAFVK